MKKTRIALLALLGCAAGISSTNVEAASGWEIGNVEIQQVQKAPGLSFREASAPLMLVNPSGTSPELTVTVEGRCQNSHWTLVVLPGGKRIPIGADGSFRLRAKILKADPTLSFSLIQPDGTVSTARIVLHTGPWKDIQAKIQEASRPSRMHFSLAAGAMYLHYSQTGVPDVKSLLAFTEGSFQYGFTPSWNLLLQGYLAPVSFGGSPSGYSVRPIEIDLRAGYSLPWVHFPWKLRIMSGGYYRTLSTSSPTGAPFGYTIVGGPELFPMLERTFDTGASADLYAKISPVTSNFSVFSLTNREIASGFRYYFAPNPSHHGFLIQADLSNLSLQSVVTPVSETSFSVGTGYRW